MSSIIPPPVNRGAEWHRWEPHVHAPGTILNDGYSGANVWELYLDGLEKVTPALRAIGVTDYCSIETYKRVKSAKEQGRLPQCDVLFPNVELRLDTGTKKGNQVNIHLLVNPEAPNHIEELERFLGQLKFSAHDDVFVCTSADLRRLGRKHNPAAVDDRAALVAGTNQFKVSRQQLVDAFRSIGWAQDNILIAVAGGADGTSGVQEASDATMREEIEKAAHAIFASNPKQREFWLGRSASQDASAIRARYSSLKPCLWGSDAHELAKVGKPDENRFCWIKGVPHFDTLKQACIDPTRAFVGEQPPSWATPSQVISDVRVSGADWAQNPHIQINPGFVAIIGARGSGKTALADMIAAGCEAYENSDERPSFLNRAHEHLSGAAVELTWLDGRVSSPCALDQPVSFSWDAFPRARYLSQQFVETICSIDGMPKLVEEIERVIFEAHSETERDGSVNFEELRALKVDRFRDTREREELALADISDQIGIELDKERLVTSLKQQVKEKENLIKQYTADKTSLLPKGSSKHSDRLQQIETAAEKVRQNLRYFVGRQAALNKIGDEVVNFRTNVAPNVLRDTKIRNATAGLDDNDWVPFLQNYSGDVDTVVRTKVAAAEKNANSWRGVKPTAAVTTQGAFLADDADLTRQPLAVLEAEKERLQALVAVDKGIQNRLAAVSRKLVEESAALENLRERLKDCESAKERAAELVKERESGYVRVFEALLNEERELKTLYAPLKTQLTAAGGSLAKLSFSVTRIANHAAWAKRGEKELFDLRSGPFKGIGSLEKAADDALRPAWEKGSAADVAAAMHAFRKKYESALLEKATVAKTDLSNYRAWARRLAQWLYSTDHISIRYGIEYDGIDIRKLSPGTRGIVVLMLYLALDRDDVRPLIIDQPEENLDPKSIFDELVPMFESARRRRQVIMVTHNANLVVNADADQIIIATVGAHTSEGLPPISYRGGGLEEGDIRTQVCDILEGGQEAFKERARRLRVALNR